jgi:succinoglycan biosynthesis protein ExoM
MRDAYTSNALVRKDLLVGIGQPFDPDFGRTGGSDHILFRRLDADGARMVWIDDAIVHEHVPQERASLNWLLRRSFRTGAVATRGLLLGVDDSVGSPRRVAIALRAVVNFMAWTAIAVFRAPFSQSRSVRAALDAASYLGRLLAVFGHRYQEYRH